MFFVWLFLCFNVLVLVFNWNLLFFLFWFGNIDLFNIIIILEFVGVLVGIGFVIGKVIDLVIVLGELEKIIFWELLMMGIGIGFVICMDFVKVFIKGLGKFFRKDILFFLCFFWWCLVFINVGFIMGF